jgi:Protein of unknown function DUF262
MHIIVQVKDKDFDVALIPQIVEEKSTDMIRYWSVIHDDIELAFAEQPLGILKILKYSDSIITESQLIEEQINQQLLSMIEVQQQGFDDSDESSDYETEPYDPKQIRVRTENWSVKYIFELIHDYKDVDLSPDFQREFVWDSKRKSLLIESLMLGIPIPAFYLAENQEGKYHVVDGLQRLTVISQYLNNEFPLRNLEYLKKEGGHEAEGRYYKEEGKKKGISHEYLRRIAQTQLNVNIIDKSSPMKVKYDIFRRINTGGKPLNNQEIRNCLAEPHVRILLNELAKSNEFQLATDGSVKTVRMDAQELILRFIAFYYERILKEPDWSYTGNMKFYLNEIVEKLNREKGKNHEKLKQDFLAAMKNAFHLFGKYAFRKCLPEHLKSDSQRQLINKSLFTTFSLLLSQYDPSVISGKIEEGSFASILANQLLDNREFRDNVSLNTGDLKILTLAFNETKTLLSNNLKI